MFFIIHNDKPIYEFVYTQPQRQIKQLFLIHSALDTIDYIQQKKKDYYLGQIKNQQLPMYSFVNPNLIRFVLILNSSIKKETIDKKTESQIKQFFIKVNEILAAFMLNPLYKIRDPIKSQSFDEKVKNCIKEYLKTVFFEKKK